MSKLRSLSTAFWSDPFIEDLSPNEKLLFIYLITNEKTNMLGIYEASVKKISFETGIKKDDVNNALKAFEKIGKVRYNNNYVILVNFLKHQNFNTNMKKSAIDVYNDLPKELKTSELDVSKDNPIESFETLLNHFGMVSKVEVEREYEVEVEKESKEETILEIEIYPTFEDFWDEYDKKRGDRIKIQKKWEKLNQAEKEEIMVYIPNYKLSQPNKKFRKDPSTFLNQKSWNDELIFDDDNIQNKPQTASDNLLQALIKEQQQNN